MPKGKSVSVKLDNEVVEWYRSQGENYQSRINAIIHRYKKTDHHAS
jgi:uncharacterized protein (DUF4415 family)